MKSVLLVFFSLALAAPGPKCPELVYELMNIPKTAHQREVLKKLYGPLFSTNIAALKAARINSQSPTVNNFVMEKKDWLAPDAEFAEQVQMRKGLYAHRPKDVFRVEEAYRDRVLNAGQELFDMTTAHLSETFPDTYKIEGSEIVNLKNGDRFPLKGSDPHPLVKLGSLIQDDILVNIPGPNGIPVLAGGFLATPTHWGLPSVIGMDVHQIHSEVTNYDKIKKAVEGTLLRVPGDKIFGRNNWFFEDNPSLALPNYEPAHHENPYLTTPETAPDKLFFRSEVQSIRVLPQSRAGVFFIRPRVWSLRTVKEQAPEQVPALIEGLKAKFGQYEETPNAIRYLQAP